MIDDFLIDREPITWLAPEGFPASLAPAGLFTQDAPSGLEVLLATAARRPTAADLRGAWSKRRRGRASPVLVVAVYSSAEGTRASLCGPAGDQPMVQHGVEMSQAERLARVALAEPSHHAATRFRLANLPELDSPMPGLRNVGLLAASQPASQPLSLAAGTQRDDRQEPVSAWHQSRWHSRLVWEFDAGKDKVLFLRDSGTKAMSGTADFWPVYTGKSFYLWDPDTGEYSASADPATVMSALQQKRHNGHKNKRSAFSEMSNSWIEDPATLPCLRPRIANSRHDKAFGHPHCDCSIGSGRTRDHASGALPTSDRRNRKG